MAAGLPAALHLAQQPDAVDAFAVAHGGIELPHDIDSLQKPGFVACAEKDMELSADARKQMQALMKCAFCCTRCLLLWTGSRRAVPAVSARTSSCA